MPELIQTADESGFDISIQLNPGLPLQQIESINHDIVIESVSANGKLILLEESEALKEGTTPAQDFRLSYSLLDNDISSGLLSYREGNELWFMLMAEPPRQYGEKAILPREYILIVDVSGSMNGLPMDTAKHMSEQLLYELTPQDRFNMILFAGDSDQLSRLSLEPTPDRIKKALKFLKSRNAGGNTDLLTALKRAKSLPATPGFARTLLVVSDGAIGVPVETQQYIRANLGNSNMFAFAVGQYADNASHARDFPRGPG